MTVQIFKDHNSEMGFNMLVRDFKTVSEAFSKTASRVCTKAIIELDEQINQAASMCLTPEVALIIEKYSADDYIPVFDVLDGVEYLQNVQKIPNYLIEAYLGVYEDDVDGYRDVSYEDAKEWAKHKIMTDEPKKHLEIYLQWNGILGWDAMIWNIAEGIFS